jgi:hypothetical protein
MPSSRRSGAESFQTPRTHQARRGTLCRRACEASLAFTLPREPTELDDGLLTASEVAQLKLNADRLVPSARNATAADKPGAEALSEPARLIERLASLHFPLRPACGKSFNFTCEIALASASAPDLILPPLSGDGKRTQNAGWALRGVPLSLMLAGMASRRAAARPNWIGLHEGECRGLEPGRSLRPTSARREASARRRRGPEGRAIMSRVS